MRPKVIRYYAYNEDALRNGSFWREIKWSAKETTFSQYMNGDFMGSHAVLPVDADLKPFEPKAAKALLPECCR